MDPYCVLTEQLPLVCYLKLFSLINYKLLLILSEIKKNFNRLLLFVEIFIIVKYRCLFYQLI